MMASERRAHRARSRTLLLRALRDPPSIVPLPPPDVDLVLRMARRVRLLALLGLRLREAGAFDSLPAGVRDQLHGALVTADARARVARWELDRIAWALRNNATCRIVVLKGGAYLLAKLPNAAGRVFADVDILVAERELDGVEASLRDEGWAGAELTPYDEHYYRIWTHELPPMRHAEREVEVDLHHNILPRTARLKPPAHSLLDRARPIEGTRFEIFCDTDLVLHAMVHLMFDSDMADALRDLVDIDELLRHFAAGDATFWARLAARSEQLGLARPAYYALRYAGRLLGTPLPDGLLSGLRGGSPPPAVLWLMDRLVPLALFPPHPDLPDAGAGLARLLLYVRSHWIRMPPLLLVRHLTRKFIATRLRTSRA